MEPMDHDFDEIVRTFVAESEENLRALDEGFVALESTPFDAEVLATIFRMAHTLKGNAASLGYVALSEFAHAVEDTLDRLRQRKLTIGPRLTTLLLRAVDALRELVLDATSGVEEMRAPHKALLEELIAETRGAAAPAAPGPPPPQGTAVDGGPHAEGDASATGADAGAGAGGAQASSRKTLRVDVERLNRMLNLVGEIAIERGRVRGMIDGVKGVEAKLGLELAERHDEADSLYAELQDMVMKLRMVPIGPTFRQQARTVRDVASALGKQVRLVTLGEDEEMDTSLVELIKDPLTHMIRNSIDHGIEAPDARRQRGKDPSGTITLSARHDAGSILIEIRDDGRGLAKDKIIERARTMGVPDPASLKDRDLYELIFEPGFSTASAVTDVSGRGVGMDVVRKNVQSLRGKIGIESHEGVGTIFRIRLPLTVAMIEGFAVSAGLETYVVPLDRVIECMELPAHLRGAEGAREVRGGRSGVIQLRGAPVPFFRLRDVFRLPAQPQARESLVVLQHDDTSIGIAVDELLGVSQVVIKPPGKLLDGRPGLAGSTILGTGKVAFILDVPGLMLLATRNALETGEVDRRRSS
jgi:two-component system chemotaxis sensor kinase CheA